LGAGLRHTFFGSAESATLGIVFHVLRRQGCVSDGFVHSLGAGGGVAQERIEPSFGVSKTV